MVKRLIGCPQSIEKMILMCISLPCEQRPFDLPRLSRKIEGRSEGLDCSQSSISQMV